MSRAADPSAALSRPRPAIVFGAIALLTLIWGSTWSFVRISLEGFPPLLGVTVRFAIAGILLLLLMVWKKTRVEGSRRNLLVWLGLAVFNFSIPYMLVFWAEQWVPSGLTAVLFSVMPIFVVLFAYGILPEERMGSAGIFGVFLGFGGVALIFSDDLDALAGPNVTFAALVLLLSPISAAVAQVVVKKWGQDISPLALAAIPMLMSAVLIAPLAWLFERDRQVLLEAEPVLALIYLAVFGSVVAFTLYYWTLKFLSATHLSLVTYATPVIAVLIGTLWLDEPLTWTMAGGALLVASGVGLAARSRSH